VADEVIGYLLTIAWTNGPSLVALVVAFFAFRLFDIWKPWPARRMEKLPHGHGILMDDVVAGLMAFLFVMLPLRLLLPDVGWSA
jgi:phosphatidylglycerophosphatase A